MMELWYYDGTVVLWNCGTMELWYYDGTVIL